jgi:hypothetical protein
MRVRALLLVFVCAFFLFSCGGGGSSAPAGKVRVNLNIDKDDFTRAETRAIPYGSESITSIMITISSGGSTEVSQDILASIENSAPVSFTLTANKSYQFAIEAFNTSNTSLCSGSTSATLSPNTNTTINLSCQGSVTIMTGVAASGLPIDGSVTVKDYDGQTRSTPIGSNGRYIADVTGLTAPFILHASGTVAGKSVSIYSAAQNTSDTTNINPYTNLALAIAVNGIDLDTVFTNPITYHPNITSNIDTAVGTVKTVFQNFLSEFDIQDADFDPLNGDYAADGSDMDGLLDNLSINVSGNDLKIIDNNTNTSLTPDGKITTASQNVLSQELATQVATFISSESTVKSDISSFLSDYYISDLQSRGVNGDYYLTSNFDWHEGVSSATISAGALPSGVTEVKDVALISRTITGSEVTSVTVFYSLVYSNTLVEGRVEKLEKSGSQWYFTGNNKEFKTKVSNFYKFATGVPDVVTTGIKFEFEDSASFGIQGFKVTGSGLPAEGIKYKLFGGNFVLNDDTTTNVYTQSDLEIEAAQAEFDANGHIEYTVTAYTDTDYSVVLPNEVSTNHTEGTPIVVYSKARPQKPTEAISTGSFLSPTMTSVDLNDIITSDTITFTTNAHTLPIKKGLATMMCNDFITKVFSTKLINFEADTYITAFDFTDSLSADLFDTCILSFQYFDATNSEYLKTYELVRSYTTEENDILTAAASNLCFDDIKGTNVLATYVHNDLSLISSLGLVNITWYSNNTANMSHTGEVAVPAGEGAYASAKLYAVLDYNGAKSYDTIEMTVQTPPPNDPPEAVDDTATTLEDTNVTIDILSNDSDPDSQAISITSIGLPSSGSVGNNGDGTITYIPVPNYNGTATIQYTITDSMGATDTATVTITVTPVNDAPMAMNDTASTTQDTNVDINVLSNDVDVDLGDNITVTNVGEPDTGSAINNGDGTITYVPAVGHSGVANIIYTITDAHGAQDDGNITVTITATNNAPVATNDSLVTNEDTPISHDLLANDIDADGDQLIITAVTQGTNGLVTILSDRGSQQGGGGTTSSVTYTPNANFNGSDSYTYTISDGNGGTDTATVNITVTPVNDAPVAISDSLTTNEDTATTLNLLTNDTDIDGDTLAVQSLGTPSNGSVVNNGDGTVTYTPNANYNGSDIFSYIVSDGNGGTASASVNVTVSQ